MELLNTTCPICKGKAEYTCYNGAWGTEEEYIECNSCNYYYEFAYGNYREIVHNKCFTWSYSDYDRLCKFPAFVGKINRAEFMARRNWKKFKKKTKLLDFEDGYIISP